MSTAIMVVRTYLCVAFSLRRVISDLRGCVISQFATYKYIAVHNKNPKPFVWTASANDILAKVIRANRNLSSKQNEALH